MDGIQSLRIRPSKLVEIQVLKGYDKDIIIRKIKGLSLISRADLVKYLAKRSKIDELYQSGKLTAFFENGTPKKVNSTEATYFDLNEWLSIDYNKN